MQKPGQRTTPTVNGDGADPLAGVPDEIVIQSYTFRFARPGGKVRWQGATKKERSAAAQRAARARWSKKKPK